MNIKSKIDRVEFMLKVDNLRRVVTNQNRTLTKTLGLINKITRKITISKISNSIDMAAIMVINSLKRNKLCSAKGSFEY